MIWARKFPPSLCDVAAETYSPTVHSQSLSDLESGHAPVLLRRKWGWHRVCGWAQLLNPHTYKMFTFLYL